MKKPIGQNGFFKVSVDETGTASGEFVSVAYPAQKDGQELVVATAFVQAMADGVHADGLAPLFTNLEQSTSENNFDFSVIVQDSPAYLELQEIAPLTGPYATAPAQYKPYDHAQHILAKIRAKAAKYPSDGGAPIFLLVYVTHWSFALSDTVIACLRVWLQQEATPFHAIFAFTPLPEAGGIAKWLAPVPPQLIAGFDPESVRDNTVLNVNPAGFVLVSKS
jgi:hypothetical protein